MAERFWKCASILVAALEACPLQEMDMMTRREIGGLDICRSWNRLWSEIGIL